MPEPMPICMKAKSGNRSHIRSPWQGCLCCVLGHGHAKPTGAQAHSPLQPARSATRATHSGSACLFGRACRAKDRQTRRARAGSCSASPERQELLWTGGAHGRGGARTRRTAARRRGAQAVARPCSDPRAAGWAGPQASQQSPGRALCHRASVAALAAVAPCDGAVHVPDAQRSGQRYIVGLSFTGLRYGGALLTCHASPEAMAVKHRRCLVSGCSRATPCRWCSSALDRAKAHVQVGLTATEPAC